MEERLIEEKTEEKAEENLSSSSTCKYTKSYVQIIVSSIINMTAIIGVYSLLTRLTSIIPANHSDGTSEFHNGIFCASPQVSLKQPFCNEMAFKIYNQTNNICNTYSDALKSKSILFPSNSSPRLDILFCFLFIFSVLNALSVIIHDCSLLRDPEFQHLRFWPKFIEKSAKWFMHPLYFDFLFLFIICLNNSKSIVFKFIISLLFSPFFLLIYIIELTVRLILFIFYPRYMSDWMVGFSQAGVWLCCMILTITSVTGISFNITSTDPSKCVCGCNLHFGPAILITMWVTGLSISISSLFFLIEWYGQHTHSDHRTFLYSIRYRVPFHIARVFRPDEPALDLIKYKTVNLELLNASEAFKELSSDSIGSDWDENTNNLVNVQLVYGMLLLLTIGTVEIVMLYEMIWAIEITELKIYNTFVLVILWILTIVTGLVTILYPRYNTTNIMSKISELNQILLTTAPRRISLALQRPPSPIQQSFY